MNLDRLLPGDLAWPPRGWIALLRERPELSMAGVEAATVPPHMLRLLPEVNVAVNGEISYEVEPRDDWRNVRRREVVGFDGKRRIVRVSDCEEYALEKLRRLLKHGVPRGALLLTYCLTPLGEPHVVLWAVADDGGRVLDNRVPAVRTPINSDLRFVKQEIPGRWWWRRMAGFKPT